MNDFSTRKSSKACKRPGRLCRSGARIVHNRDSVLGVAGRRAVGRRLPRALQDIKRRRDIVKKARWDELARYDDMKKELDAQLAEAKMKAAVEAEIKAKAEFVLKLFKSKYLNEETKWLEDLTEYQYDQIFKKLIEDASLEEIKKIIGD